MLSFNVIIITLNIVEKKFITESLLQIGHGYTSRQKKTRSNSDDHLIRDNDIENVTVINDKTRHYKRFKVTGRELTMKFNPPEEGFDSSLWDWARWLENIFRKLTERILAASSSNHYIGLEIHNENFTKPVWFSFRPVYKFDYRDLMTLIETMAQSWTEFDVREEILTVVVSLVKVPAGRGRTKLLHVDLCGAYKRSVLQIKQDKSCLARSLCLCYTHAMRGQIRTGVLHERWNKIRKRNCRLQLQEAENLE